MYIDSFFYGKTVIAPLGIVLYNVFGKGGPNLYGEAKTRFHMYMLHIKIKFRSKWISFVSYPYLFIDDE